MREKKSQAHPVIGGMVWAKVKVGWISTFRPQHTILALLPSWSLSLPTSLFVLPGITLQIIHLHPKSLSGALLLGGSQSKKVSLTMRPSSSTECAAALGEHSVGWWPKAGPSAETGILTWANQGDLARPIIHASKKAGVFLEQGTCTGGSEGGLGAAAWIQL